MKQLTGFTIIELMVTVSLVAVLLTVGVPAFQGLAERNQLTSHINSFISSLALARSEAVKRRQRVVVCVSNDSATCANNGAYESGWIVYVDADDDGARDETNADEELLWVSEQLPVNFTLRANGNFTNSIHYLASGKSSGANNLGTGSVFLCKESAVDKARMIIVNGAGRVRLAKHNSSGVPMGPSGALASCV